MITVIIVSYNTVELLRKCLWELFAQTITTELEVFVVDNNSADDSVQMVQEEFPQVKLIVNRDNRGFAAANNQAWHRSSGEYILLLNPDAYVRSQAVDFCLDFMATHPQCGLCGGRLIKEDGTLDPSARKFPNFINKLFTLSGLMDRFPHSALFAGHEFGNFNHKTVMEVDWVPGTFCLCRRSMLQETGFFDERFYIYFEETDLCRTAKKKGWKVYFYPDAEVVHVGGACSKTRKNFNFDSSAKQILTFRMQSEWLYYYKNHGLLAVLASAGVEISWHLLRLMVNLLPGRVDALAKRTSSLAVIRAVLHTLKATKAGMLAPPTPW